MAVNLRARVYSFKQVSVLSAIFINSLPLESELAGTLFPFPGQAILFQIEENWLMKPLNSRFLTVLITLAFLSICVSVPAFAAKVKDCNVPNPHPSCGGSNDHGDPPARYAVELTVGDFYFLEAIVTRNNRGNGYTSSETLDLVVGADVWETVFESCSVFFGDDHPGVFLEVSNNWSIDNSGGNQAGTIGSNILIAFRDAEFDGLYPRVDIDLYLIGELPEPGIPEDVEDDPVFITLTDFTLFGSLKGGKGCSSSEELSPNSVLKMTRMPDDL